MRRGVARNEPIFLRGPGSSKSEHRTVGAEHGLNLPSKPLFVRSESYVLPGIVIMGNAVNQKETVDSIDTAKKVAESFMHIPVTAPEVERARQEILTENNAKLTKIESEPDSWLDVDTYGLKSVQDRAASISGRFARGRSARCDSGCLTILVSATIVVGDTQQLKPLLQGRVQFEVLGEMPAKIPTTKPPTKHRGRQRVPANRKAFASDLQPNLHQIWINCVSEWKCHK